jgi:DNA processing protein
MLGENDYKLFVLSRLRNVGARAIFDVYLDQNFEDLSIKEAAELIQTRARKKDDFGSIEEAEEEAALIIEGAEKAGVHIVGPDSATFPTLLRTAKNAPAFLYVLGDTQTLNRDRMIAIVGSRRPTDHGLKICERITRYFVEQGWLIVSGLALGCDTVAHKVAVEGGGLTVAVLAHGLQIIAPESNTYLSKKIVETGGALITEYPIGTEPLPYHYAARDRIQAGLSRGVVMIQSSAGGGSLYAARECLECSRIMAVPKPTELDLRDNFDDVEANVVLTTGGDTEKIELLNLSKKSSEAIDNIFIISSKEDYPALEKELLTDISG